MPSSTPAFPVGALGEGVRVADEDINGVDQGNLTIDDVARDVTVTYNSGLAALRSSLAWATIGPDGTFQDVQMVLPSVGGLNGNIPEGTEISLGTLEPGTQIAFILIGGGDTFNDVDFSTGTLMLVDPTTGLPASATNPDPSAPKPQLLFTDANGVTRPVTGSLYHTADPTPDDLANPLNPDGREHTISGYDPAGGSGLLIAFEDLTFGAQPPGSPTEFGFSGDNDFFDVTIEVNFSPVTDSVATSFNDSTRGGITADATDDGATLGGATVFFTDGAVPGDSLIVTSFIIDGGVVIDPATMADTGIRLVENTLQSLVFEGEAPIETYEALLGGIGYQYNGVDNAPGGTRTIGFQVSDPEGLTSDVQTAPVTVNPATVGTEGDDILQGTSENETAPPNIGIDGLSGRGGNDQLLGASGDDILDGGTGDDLLIGNVGSDILNGGPGNDTLIGDALDNPFRDADTFFINSPLDGVDTIVDYRATDGDVININNAVGQVLSQDQADEFTVLTDLGNGDFELAIDIDGAGSASDPITVAILQSPVLNIDENGNPQILIA